MIDLFNWLFRKEKEVKCMHNLKKIGKFYSDKRTRYNNCSDEVEVFELSKCSICGEKIKENIITKNFPVYMLGESDRRDEFIKKLEANKFKNEDDYILNI